MISGITSEDTDPADGAVESSKSPLSSKLSGPFAYSTVVSANATPPADNSRTNSTFEPLTLVNWLNVSETLAPVTLNDFTASRSASSNLDVGTTYLTTLSPAPAPNNQAFDAEN